MKSVCIILVLFAAGVVVADDCNVVPMLQWAGEASLRKKTLANPVDTIIIHHTVTPEPTTDAECERILKAIRKYQREKLGFDDIAESFLICGNGKVYEGAGWGFVGAHTKGYNTKSIGISFIGEFGSHVPNSRSLSAAKELLSCGVTNQHVGGEYRLVGHRQVTSTASPGDALQEELESWPHWTDSL